MSTAWPPWRSAKKIDLTVVGPEVPLAAGIVNRFDDAGLPVFGPSKAAARIESSKSFAKELMLEPPAYRPAPRRYSTTTTTARGYVESTGAPVVIKADGLAAGKGVIVCRTTEEALTALSRADDCQEIRGRGRTRPRRGVAGGPRGERLRLRRRRKTSLPLAAACDYKRAGDGDTGANTGGVGAFSPPPRLAMERRRGAPRPRYDRGSGGPSPGEVRLPLPGSTLHGTDDDRQRTEGDRVSTAGSETRRRRS